MKFIVLDQTTIGKRQFPNIKPVLLIGNFDGVHLGHQSLLEHSKKIAREYNTSLAVMSFDPHPGYFFQKNYAPFSIISPKIKKELLEQHGVDYFYNVSFDDFTAQTSAQDFISNFLYKTIAPTYVIVGENFKFGQGRKGDIQLLKKTAARYSMRIHAAKLLEKENHVISSSRIRASLKQGDINTVNKLLGWDWFIELTITSQDDSLKNYICLNTNRLDKNIISLKTGTYKSVLTKPTNTENLVFSLHEQENSIKLFLPKEMLGHLRSAGDTIRIYPKRICDNINIESERSTA